MIAAIVVAPIAAIALGVGIWKFLSKKQPEFIDSAESGKEMAL